MKTHPKNNTFLIGFAGCIFFILAITTSVFSYRASDFHWRPPFTTAANEKPSVSIVLDTSNTMNKHAYGDSTWDLKPRETAGEAYNSSKEYYGYFKNTKYSYDSTNNYFYEDSTGPWSGNFMNWATMHKIDVARKILTGGVYNSTSNCFEVNTQPALGSNDKYPDDITLTYSGPLTTPFSTNGAKESIQLYQIFNTKTLQINQYDNKALKSSGQYTLRIYNPTPDLTGVLDDFKTKARFALFRFINEKTTGANEHEGGYLLVPMTDTEEGMNLIKYYINTTEIVGQATPLAESLYTVENYVRGSLPSGSYNASTTPPDAFYFPNYDDLVSCTQQSVIMITGGESSFDEKVPYKNMYPDVPQNREPYKSTIIPNGSTHIIPTSYYIHTQDLRPYLDGKQNINMYTVFAFGKASILLKHASIWGGFTDKDGDNKPSPDPINFLTETDARPSSEYNTDKDKYPDNYFEALTGAELEFAITAALDLATRNLMSGTAAAVTSQTRSGEGAVYQALFFPPNNATSTSQVAPAWGGQIHALLLDSRGNMREDSNSNKKLDPYTDKIIQFQDIGNSINLNLYTDINGDSILSDDEKSIKSNSTITNIKFLWSSTEWLNNISNATIVSQRAYSDISSDKRHIITFADIDNDSIVDSGEIQDFALASAPSSTSLQSTNNFYSYLTLYDSASGAIGPPSNTAISATHFPKLAKRQVDFIRGLDQPDVIDGTTVSDPIRSRNQNGKTWRLGDIVYSSPTIVGAPAENYHVLYNDNTYKDFYLQYRDRRQVIYTGANDGMIHAFNAGFYNSTSRGFDLKKTSEAQHKLGSELWAYVPYNLLPHLRWLMDPDYGERIHVAYMDLKPRIFDARVFTNSTTHPNGWGTILVAGMRFGGAKIDIDVDKATPYTGDRTASSAYVIMDITNPEQPPTVLGEIRMPKQGFTTCFPTVMPMGTANTQASTNNEWYLVFGSGPANANGDALPGMLDGYRSPDIPTHSQQNGQLFVLDLTSLVQSKTITTLGSDGNFYSSGHIPFATTEANSYISDPIAVDIDLGSGNSSKEMKTDIVYYGTVAGSNSAPTGTIRRILTNNIISPTPSSNWTGNSILASTDQPITSAASVSMDEKRNLWVYFGTGRFFNRGDIPQQRMTFYGIREPKTNATIPSSYTWAEVDENSLFNSTEIVLNGDNCTGEFSKSCVNVVNTTTGATMKWDDLLTIVNSYPGWRHDFSVNWERVLGQAATIGGAVLFTSYLPNPDICAFEGDSRLYAFFYKTGTAYYEPILAGADTDFAKFVGLGKGMAITPNIHIGEQSGSTAFIQTSTGAIQAIEVENPISVKSGQLFWRKNTD